MYYLMPEKAQQSRAGRRCLFEALIVSPADKYDALRSARQYKPAFTHEKTTRILLEDDRTGAVAKDVFGQKLTESYLEIQQGFADIYDSLKDV